jgi:hypothetical protein
VTVVVEEYGVADLGDRGDEEIDRRRPAMLAPLCKSRLTMRRGAFATIVER